MGCSPGPRRIRLPISRSCGGGTADAPFDPNYHKATDTIDHIDKTALGILGGGVVFSVGIYAQDIEGRNGIPIREDRTRHAGAVS